MRQSKNSDRDSSSGKPKSLYRELTVALVVLVSLVSITVNLFNYLYSSHEAEASYESELSNYEAYLHEAFEWPLWNIDDELIVKVGSAFASNAEIVSLAIRDDQQRVVYHQEKPNGNLVKRVIAIEHNGQNIGSVEIGLTLKAYEEKNRQLLLISITTMVLLIVALLGVLRWILSRLLRKPVDAFVSATGDIVEGKYRQIELPETYVEFAPVLSGFKAMSNAVASRENSLRESEEKFRKITESAQDAIIIMDADQRISAWNLAAEHLFGYTAAEAIGQELHPLIAPPETQQAFKQGFVHFLQTGTGPVVGKVTELIALRKGGEVFPVEGSLAALSIRGQWNAVGIFRDITERKRAEEALRASEERWQFALEGAGDGVWDWDVQTNQTIFSKRWKEMIGYAEDEFDNNFEAWKQHIHPDDLEPTLATLQDYFDGRSTTYNTEFRMRCKDGGWKWILACGKIVGRDANGQPLRLIGTHADISERKKAEQEVAKLSLQNKLILDSAGEGIYGLDIDGRCTFVNPAALQFLGFRVEELLGQHSHSIFHHTRSDGRPYQAEECPVQAAYKQGEVYRGRDLYWRKDGSSFPVEFISAPILETGKITGAVVTFRDITERKLAEEQLRRTAQGLAEAQRIAHLGNWNLDLVHNVLTWSDEIYRIFEIDPGEIDVSYDAFLNAIHPDDREMVNNAHTESVKSKIPYDIEFRLLMTDGRVKYLNEKGESHYSEDGKPLRSVGTVHDITERKKAEEELRRYRDHLEEEVQQRTADLVLALTAAEAANRAKSVFLSNMSHELRTPLNAILGFSSMMRKDPLLSQEQRVNLDIINRSGEHLLTLINDVLEMAKIEAGRVQLENAPFDLGGLVRDVTDMMQLRAQEKGLQLLIDQSSKFPRYIKGDEARLRQVLINLVGNAVKFTRQGGVTVRFGMKPHATPQRLLIEVEDSGIGIKPEDQEKIFEPFVQLGQSSAQKGTGLGLTITRQFVQLIGGTISVESAPGTGSTFRVEMPVDKVAAADVVKLENVVRGEIVSLAPGQPKYRILIAEDQLENQLLLTKLMENVGFPVKVAENGEQALELFQSWRPHLIWMDRRMPVMDGEVATRRIRELPGGKEVKIIAVTASAFTEQRDEMLKAGMDDFVRKPYRFNEIYECLTKQLGVQYTYTDAQSAEEVSDVALTAQMLAVLPQDLRRELHDALESLESERITAVIGQVASYDPMLHKTLSHLAGNFDYPAIIKALQTKQPVNVT